MSEKLTEVIERYSQEISDIAYKLKQLEDGRIYEFSNAQMDGYLATNVKQLRNMFSDLVSKIVDNKESRNDKIAEIFNIK